MYLWTIGWCWYAWWSSCDPSALIWVRTRNEKHAELGMPSTFCTIIIHIGITNQSYTAVAWKDGLRGDRIAQGLTY